MTAYPEGYLARELELCYANISMVTDHDVGVEGAEPVSHEQVVTVFNQNNERLRELLFAVIPRIRPQPEEHLCATRAAREASRDLETVIELRAGRFRAGPRGSSATGSVRRPVSLQP